MGEARRPCPYCARPVGGRHFDFCPRSRDAQAALRVEMRPRSYYPSKGFFAGFDSDGEAITGFNPGVPQVYAPKPRTAGGLPKGPASWWNGQLDPKTRQPVILQATKAAVEGAIPDFLDGGRFADLGRRRPEARS